MAENVAAVQETDAQVFSFDDVTEIALLEPPQGPGTNALVQNPFEWADSE